MKAKGAKSVRQAISEALTDIEKECRQYCMKPHFTIFELTTRVKAYVGNGYHHSDSTIERTLRAMKSEVFSYRYDRTNGFYYFNYL